MTWGNDGVTPFVNGSIENGTPVPGRGPLAVVANGRTIYLPSVARLLLSAEARRERTRLLGGQFFLVSMRAGNLGEIFRCGRCGGKHARLTKYCIDRPFSGLFGGLYAYVKTLGDAADSGILTPAQHARYQAIAAAVAGAELGHPPPDLAVSHPVLARQLTSAPGPLARRPNDVDLDIGMVALGVCERVEPQDAQRLLDRINTRATAFNYPLLRVPGLRVVGRR
jgi:hypothetical protein